MRHGAHSDVYEHLHKIKVPMLFMHGENDDICPLSQSYVGYNVIRHSVRVRT